jgi:hypothetical protein
MSEFLDARLTCETAVPVQILHCPNKVLGWAVRDPDLRKQRLTMNLDILPETPVHFGS